MSKKEIILPGHGTLFNRFARENERQEEHLRKEETKLKNHKNPKSNNKEEWTLANPNKIYLMPFFKKNGESLILKPQDLPERVVPINVIEIESRLVS